MSRRTACPGSSPGLSTKEKTKLWQKLRKLDALCHRYNPSRYNRKYSFIFFINNKEADKARQMFAKYDEQRREVRNKLKQCYGQQKGYG
jgi:hypothetical protein